MRLGPGVNPVESGGGAGATATRGSWHSARAGVVHVAVHVWSIQGRAPPRAATPRSAPSYRLASGLDWSAEPIESVAWARLMGGAEAGTRTRKVLPPGDFEFRREAQTSGICRPRWTPESVHSQTQDDALLAHLRAVEEIQREMLARLERIEEAVSNR